MIGKGKSISHTKASIQYGWNEEKYAKVILQKNLVGNTPGEITKEFKFIQQFNTNCKRNTFSFVLSPTIEDGKNLTIKLLKKITAEFIADLKLNQHQAVAFVHLDKNHKHIHLYVNRINFDGIAYNDSFIGKRSQKSAERVAKKLGLKTVQEVLNEKKNSTKSIRNSIYNLHKECISKQTPENFDEYIAFMHKYNIDVIPSISKSNQLIGFNYKYKKQKFKGSAVHRSMSINKTALEIKHPNFKTSYSKNNGIKLKGKIVSLNPKLVNAINKTTKKEKLNNYNYGKNRSNNRTIS